MSDDREKQIYKNLKEISDTFHLGRNYGEEKDIEQALDYITALTEKIKEREGEIKELRKSLKVYANTLVFNCNEVIPHAVYKGQDVLLPNQESLKKLLDKILELQQENEKLKAEIKSLTAERNSFQTQCGNHKREIFKLKSKLTESEGINEL